MSRDYEDKRYVFFNQEEMDGGEGSIVTSRDRSELRFEHYAEPPPYYVYELVEVILPEEMKDHSDEKRPIKVTYV